LHYFAQSAPALFAGFLARCALGGRFFRVRKKGFSRLCGLLEKMYVVHAGFSSSFFVFELNGCFWEKWLSRN
jgi:hypothetical protein